jgi:hypothetical protein
MRSKFLRAILVPLVTFVLLGPGNAGRMSDFARRKGFGAHLASNDWEEARTTPWGPDNFRFLTPKTTREEYPTSFRFAYTETKQHTWSPPSQKSLSTLERCMQA